MKTKIDLLKLCFHDFIDFSEISDNKYLVCNDFRYEYLEVNDLTEKFLSQYPKYKNHEILFTSFEANDGSYFEFGESFKVDILIDKKYIVTFNSNFYYNMFNTNFYDFKRGNKFLTRESKRKISITEESIHLCLDLINDSFDFAISNSKNRIRYLTDPYLKQKMFDDKEENYNNFIYYRNS